MPKYMPKEPVKMLPEYLNFLLSPDSPLDFHINVRGLGTTTEERFPVDKWMLMAKSKVLRKSMLESVLKHDSEFAIVDIDPVTFRHFLIYLYGYDNTSSLTFEEAVNLLCAAEKYLVEDLKKTLGERISRELTVDNLFVVLQRAYECETIPELWSEVIEMIQKHTKEIFSHPQFKTTKPEAVKFMVQQDHLSVAEIDVWQAAYRWAQDQVQAVGGVVSPASLRLIILPLLKHIRLCTLSYKDLVEEVIPSRVLTGEEVALVCESAATRVRCDSLTDICSEVVPRGHVSNLETLNFVNGNESVLIYEWSGMNIALKNQSVELVSAVFTANDTEPSGGQRSYQCQGNVYIDACDNQSEYIQISVNQTVDCSKDFEVPLNYKLTANTKYNLSVEFTDVHKAYIHNTNVLGGTEFDVTWEINAQYKWSCHVKALNYRILSKN